MPFVFRVLNLVIVVAVIAVVLGSRPAWTQTDKPTLFDLPSQPLAKSVIDIGKAAGVSIIVPSELLEAYTAPPLVGSMDPLKALNVVLAGTKLKIKRIDTRVLAIVRVGKRRERVLENDLYFEEMVVVGEQVTGSFLTRTDTQGASPVEIITSYELNISGSQNVAEFLKYIPAVSGNSTSTAISNGGDGTATVTLRGLPANNTLVLVNGRRISTEGLSGNTIDLNAIPSAAVERIEILKDGASASYGTDAIAGVVNIILREEYDGALFEQYYGQASAGDAETQSSHLMFGKRFDRSSIMASLQYYDQNAVMSRDREVSASVDGRGRGGIDRRSSTPERTVLTLDGETLLLTPGRDGSSAEDFAPGENPRYNYAQDSSSLSPSRRVSAYSSAIFELSDRLSLAWSGAYTETNATITLAAVPFVGDLQNPPIPVSAFNLFNPFEQDITDVRRRFVELGPRQQQNSTELKRSVLSLEGFTDRTQWQLGLNYSRTDAHQRRINQVSPARLALALGSERFCELEPNCVLLNIFGPTGSIPQEQLNYIRTSQASKGRAELQGIDGRLVADLAELRAGALGLAIGFDFRKESIQTRSESEDTRDRLLVGASVRDPSFGERIIRESFIETHIPLIKRYPFAHSLDIEAAVRYSRYSDFGENTSPKFGLRYRPIETLLLRGTYSEGFRAPNLAELFGGTAQSQLPLDDPCSDETRFETLPGCNGLSDPTQQQFLTTLSSSEELLPETSISRTYGFVWTPRKFGDLQLSVDRFDIRQDNIVEEDTQLILEQNALGTGFLDNVIRNDDGDIIEIFAPFINVGLREIRGFDTTAKWLLRNPTLGDLTLSLNTTYVEDYWVQLNPEMPIDRVAGTFRDALDSGRGAIPRWKATTGAFWSYKNFELNYSLNYIHHMQENSTRLENGSRRISSWTTHDAQLSYRTQSRPQLKFIFGVDNISDKSPPFSATAFNDNYDARTYDIKGRFYYSRILIEF